MLKTYCITVTGLVQGVGFRPFVYNLATKFSLKGTVSNNQMGLVVFVTGLQSVIDEFYNALVQNPPPVSRIKSSLIYQIDLRAFSDFKIIPSNKNGRIDLPLTPDFAICEDCKNDLLNPKNKRYQYPFTTCVNCGPRWAITKTFPFERNHTSIDDFKMCDSCQTEYVRPADRRFHSQTNTCNHCGVSLFLTDNKGTEVKVATAQLFKKIVQLLSDGAIIAIKNTSGYLLCCNAQNELAIKKLRIKKNRPNKPFAVLFPSLASLKKEFSINEYQLKSLTSTQCPINIIPFNKYKGAIALNAIAPKLNQIGVLLPYSGILQLLASELDFPIVATSGNIHGSPIISNNELALKSLNKVADFFLQHNLQITHPQDDSVVKFSAKYSQEVLFRRSRGYAPNYFNAQINSDKKILAMGAHLKSSIAFYPNNYLYVSQYLGNLDNFEVYNRFTDTVADFISIFEQPPERILIDKHPRYQSSQFGKELALKINVKCIEIQHHKAHFAAILGEYQLFDKKVLGVIFDGTGYGDDAAIWGGEFFSYSSNHLERINHLDYFNWILGDKMSKEPRLSLLALSTPQMTEILAHKFKPNELKTYRTLLKTNTLKTSSVGRLFDAVASLLNIADFNTYEGEAAILLENALNTYELKSCKSYLNTFEKGFSAHATIAAIFEDIKLGISNAQIIANFLFTLASYSIQFAEDNHYQHIAFSGGVFQNTTLVDMLLELAPKTVNLYFHKDLSPNDENISFGQMLYYLNIKE